MKKTALKPLGLGLLLLGSTAAASAAADERHQPLNIHGEAYLPACAQAEWRKLHGSVLEAAADRDAGQLAGAVWNYLCGAGEAAARRLRRSLPARVFSVGSQTGTEGEVKRFVPRAEFSTLAGQAWGASVGEEGGKVVVSYYPNEACVASVTFAFRDRRWLLTRMSDACD